MKIYMLLMLIGVFISVSFPWVREETKPSPTIPPDSFAS